MGFFLCNGKLERFMEFPNVKRTSRIIYSKSASIFGLNMIERGKSNDQLESAS